MIGSFVENVARLDTEACPQLMPTPCDVLHTEGTLRLLHFRPSGRRGKKKRTPLVVVPSMINRWYIVDLRPGASLIEALVNAGHDVWCVDWGRFEDEDRYLTWDDCVARLHRAVRRVQRECDAEKVGMLGYCMGATLSGVWAALNPGRVATFVNMLGPFDFSRGGMLSDLVNPEWFDAEALTAGGNLPADQMQTGFTSLRPTTQISKWVNLFHSAHDPKRRESFYALETWATDNVPFPAAAYRTYIGELYQQNLLVQGKHYVAGRRVDLKKITCDVLTVATESDTICPLPAARAFNQCVGSAVKEELVVKGGHIGAVVGSRASRILYPALSDWFTARL